MQLLCNGFALDLKAGAKLSFKKENPLFAFDALTCERTQSFDIPATSNNERVFGLAKLPAFSGQGMRRRFDAELQDGLVVKRGYLYVDAYEKNTYKGIFVTGDLLGLKRVKEAGNIDQLIAPPDTITWSTNLYDKAANDTNLRNFDLVSYKDEKKSGWQKDEQVHPSYALTYVLQKALASVGVSASLPIGANKLRVILGELKGANANVSVRQYVTDNTQPHTSKPYANYNGIELTNANDIFGLNSYYFATYRYISESDYQTYYYRMRQLQALANVAITFGEDFPSNVFMVSFGDSVEFIGDYSFVKNYSGQVVTQGEPLAGRTVEVAIGTCFIFLTPDDYAMEEGERSEYTIEGWRISSLPSTYTFGVETSIVNGSIVRLVDNLPALTIIDLLKVIAATSGRVLNYSERTGITFDALDFDTWPMVQIDGQVLSVGRLARTFGDYAQRNVLEFDSDETVQPDERIMSAYTIDNDNIEREKILQTIPYSEGGQMGGVLYLRNGGDAEVADTLSRCGSVTNLLRAELPTNINMQRLCNASTCVTIKMRMTLAQYERMHAKITILYAGTRYVWTSATWSNDIATIILSKI